MHIGKTIIIKKDNLIKSQIIFRLFNIKNAFFILPHLYSNNSKIIQISDVQNKFLGEKDFTKDSKQKHKKHWNDTKNNTSQLHLLRRHHKSRYRRDKYAFG